MSTRIKKVILAGAVLIVILVSGVSGYMILEKWTFLESVWMTLITMSTVGFGEVRELDPQGRVLTILIILSTIFVGGYAVGNISAFIIGGEVGSIIKGHRMERIIGKLKNHLILIGYGAVGTEVAVSWIKDELIIVERDPERFQDAIDHGYKAIHGDATNEEVMHGIGIEKAKGLVIAIGVVADTILIALTARELNPELTIAARIDDASAISKLKKVGVDRIVLPSQIGARRLNAFIKHPGIVDFLDLVMGRGELSLRLEEMKIQPHSFFSGKTISEANVRKKTNGGLVMSIIQDNGVQQIPPDPDYIMNAGDSLIMLGNEESLQIAGQLAGLKSV